MIVQGDVMKYTDNQIAAIEHFKGPALVLAVPGAGKTTVLVRRTQRLIEKGVAPQSILSISFSKMQATDMQRRFLSLAQDSTAARRCTFSTIHAFSYSILREYDKRRGLHRRVIEGDRTYNKSSALRRLYYELHRQPMTDLQLEDFLSVYSYLKNTKKNMETYQKESKLPFENFDVLVTRYESFKEQNHLIDFDDMLTEALRLLKENPRLLAGLRRRFSYLQVDEYQDTSLIQAELIALLAAPENNLFLVADDDQSIYSFRGATPDEILKFSQRYPTGTTFFMEENHRSGPEIVRLGGAFIQGNENRYQKNIYTHSRDAIPVQLRRVSDVRSQYDAVVERIRELQQNYPRETVGILYRNNLSAIGMMDALHRASIQPSIRNADHRFFFHPILEDMKDFFEFSRRQNGLDVFERIYYKMNAYIKRDQLEAIRYEEPHEDVFERLLNLEDLPSYYEERFLTLQYSFRYLGKLSFGEAVPWIYENLGYAEFLEERSRREGTSPLAAEKVVETLVSVSEGLATTAELEQKLAFLRKEMRSRRPMRTNLTLSTVHGAKGLEYDNCFLIDVTEGEFPSERAFDDAQGGKASDLDEERRLCYVAITRAKRRLFVSGVLSRNNEKIGPSPFLLELEQALREKN